MMNWEQKLEALQGLDCEISLRMRAPGNWYVDHRGIEVKKHGSAILRGEYGNGRTPEEAVEDHWRLLTGLGPEEYVVLHAMLPEKRRHVVWSGFMWAESVHKPGPSK
jgi:hypothetical protein